MICFLTNSPIQIIFGMRLAPTCATCKVLSNFPSNCRSGVRITSNFARGQVRKVYRSSMIHFYYRPGFNTANLCTCCHSLDRAASLLPLLADRSCSVESTAIEMRDDSSFYLYQPYRFYRSNDQHCVLRFSKTLSS